jgi:hypothetical protein
VYNAMTDLASDVNESDASDPKSIKCCLKNINPSIRYDEIMARLLNTLSSELRCLSGSPCKTPNGELCGFQYGGGLVEPSDPRDGLPPGIYICPLGASGSSGCGGKRACTIIHEMMHSKGASEREALEAEKCIGCSTGKENCRE